MNGSCGQSEGLWEAGRSVRRREVHFEVKLGEPGFTSQSEDGSRNGTLPQEIFTLLE